MHVNRGKGVVRSRPTLSYICLPNAGFSEAA